MTDLRDDLHALAADVAWPATPDLAAAVQERLAAAPARRAPSPRHRGERRLVAVLAALLLGLPAAALAVTPARHAMLDALGLRHVTVQRRPAPPPAADPRLGARTTLAGAARAAGFAPRVPAALGAPSGVYERDGIVTMTFDRSGRLLLAQARGTLQREVLIKVVAVDDRVERVRVDGAPGIFLRAGHAYAWSDATGALVRSGPALVWERGGLVLRLEGEPDLTRAAAIAGSVS
jgi:hypothetical protein